MSLHVNIKKKIGHFSLDVAFDLEQQVLGFLGASGCGKSMLLKCIAGIITPDSGQIILNGVTLFDKEKHINLRPQERKVGYLFQNYALFPHMTVAQNISCGACRESDPGKKNLMVQQILQTMALEGLEKRKPSQLSGGQQQRVALARILVNRPEILLLDEPFSALDAFLKLQLQTEMRSLLKDFGRDVLMVSHSRDEIYRMCQSLVIMDQGHLENMGPVKDMFRDPGTLQGAILTGCKNCVPAKKSGDYEVYVPSWHMTFTTCKPVEDHLRAIGIRAHYFNPKSTQNPGNVVYLDEMEEPFALILKFRYKEADPSSEPIWWRIPKEKRPAVLPEQLGISPQNIMLLY